MCFAAVHISACFEVNFHFHLLLLMLCSIHLSYSSESYRWSSVNVNCVYKKMAPSLCGPMINSRKSFLAFAWSLTTLLSIFAFGVSVYLASRIHQQYNSMTTDEYTDWFSNEYLHEYNRNHNCRYLEGGGGDQRDGEEGQHDRNQNNRNSGDEGDRNRDGCHEFDSEFFEAMASANSRSLEFAGVYTTILGVALSLYGSTVIVGFMSLSGEYIPPCFSFRSMSLENEGPEDATTGPRKLWGEKIHRGIFLGCLVVFANLSILCAVIFGELKVRFIFLMCFKVH